MQISAAKAISLIAQLGTLEQMQELAKQGYAPSIRPKVNSHIHLPPNFSAFDSVHQAVSLAAQQSVRVLGVSNYYDFSVYHEFAAQARRLGIFPLFGVEIVALLTDLAGKGIRINDPQNPGKMYICGKGITRFTEPTPRAVELISIIRRNDDRRMAAMIERLAKIFASHGLQTHLDTDTVIAKVVSRHACERQTVTLQERHVAQAFQEVFFAKVQYRQRNEFLSELFGVTSKVDPSDAVTIQDQIRSQLMKAGKPAFVDETFVNFQQAYELILELGGIPCYPVLADGVDPVCQYETPVEKLIQALKEHNVHLAELVAIRNQPDVLSYYAKTMREAGIGVLAGTEHNTLDLLPIEPTCAGKADIPQEIKEIFVEGAYLVAAHQFLTLHNQCGFVDSTGRADPSYKTAQERISAFAKLGAAVIQQSTTQIKDRRK